MATHFSILAWGIPWIEEPGGLQSIGSPRVGHEWSNLAHKAHTFYIFRVNRGWKKWKITADGHCSHEIERRLLLERKAMINLDSGLKSKDITLQTKVCTIKAMVFPVVMYGCESWTIKNAECWRINAFELWIWRRLLRVPWTTRRSNQSILKEINPRCSLEGLILKLKLQYFGHLIQRNDSFEKTLMLGKIEGRRRRGQQRIAQGKGKPHGQVFAL